MMAEGNPGNPPLPVIGDTATKLGIRERDLRPDREGNAQPGHGGMSVVSPIDELRRRVARRRFPPTMIPNRLHRLVPGAAGPNALRVFRIGDGRFERGALTERVALEPDIEDHGTIQPTALMEFNAFKAAIVAIERAGRPLDPLITQVTERIRT